MVGKHEVQKINNLAFYWKVTLLICERQKQDYTKTTFWHIIYSIN